MGDDHLDRETAVSAELTERGVKASAKSRLVAAIDRFGGNLFELMNAPLEAGTSRRRAKIDGERQLIEAAVRYGIKQIEADPEFAGRALRGHFEDIFRKQQNTERVLQEAIEDIHNEPPSAEQATEGPQQLDEAFAARFERYAEEASTDELRQRWGRVLASEIRKPGTFSRKVLRAVDELDGRTAKLFEDLCQSRLVDTIPKCMVGELDFPREAALKTADLLVEPGLGQLRRYVSITDSEGIELWFNGFGDYGVAFPKRDNFQRRSGIISQPSPMGRWRSCDARLCIV